MYENTQTKAIQEKYDELMGLKTQEHNHENHEGSVEYDSEEDNICCDSILNSQEMTLDKTLQRTVHNYQFFKNSKNPMKLSKDATVIAMNRFFEVCRDVPQPNFINYHNKTLFFVDDLITDENSLAVKEFLIAAKGIPKKVVKSLIIDSCQMKDQ